MHEWVARRKTIMKRPFLATLEKVLNPLHASILITSVFHIPYLEKMVQLGFMAGFEGVIVLKRGLEGSLAPSLAKATGILCAAKTQDGDIITKTFEGSSEEYAIYKAELDIEVENLTLEKNRELISMHILEGKTANDHFNKQVVRAESGDGSVILIESFKIQLCASVTSSLYFPA